MNSKNKNILELFLKQLKVKYTHEYADKLYREHPYKDSLKGMADMLSDYQLETMGIKMNDKNEIQSLTVPFMAIVDERLVLIHRQTNEYIYCIWREMEFEISVVDFKLMWDGIALLAEKTEKTVEPTYKEHYIKQLYRTFQKKALTACILLLALIGFVTNCTYTHPGLWLLLLVNLAGGYIGYLIIQKELSIHNKHADKICSLFKKGGCNNVLNSPAAKFMGIIGWSEVGFGYFISNLLIIILFPKLLPYLALINICALPYSFWSIWYQKFRAKQWCPLCLIVQLVLWMVLIINLIFHFISIPPFTGIPLFLTGIIYLLPFLLISLSLPILSPAKQSHYTLETINELKMKPEVFKALLKQQAHYDVSLHTSQIIWGNKEANLLISVLTNPHCGPCAAMHRYLENLLKKAENKICIQYIFCSFDENLDSCRFLTAVYLSDMDEKKKKEIYNKWFEYGKYNKEEFFAQYGLSIHNSTVDTEINKHIEWKTKADLHDTPTILINGYELPYHYRIEDIAYFTGLKI